VAFLITNVESYAGPGAVETLLKQGETVLCHDRSFAEVGARRAFETRNPGAVALAARTPEEIHGEATARSLQVGAIVSNDIYPITPRPIETIPIEDLRATFEAVLAFPFRLAQLFIAAFKERRSGAIVFVTSARPSRPEPGFAVPTTIRAGTTAFAKALAVELAPFGVQVNVVAPNYLASELYYPKARFVDDPAGRKQIADTVPFGRLGEPREVGELIAFLASGRSAFTTGQVIHFTGGWS
jgi:NAD(P)-dependent dehydrogenase (short-subunit alcohol dehydrogenase family)